MEPAMTATADSQCRMKVSQTQFMELPLMPPAMRRMLRTMQTQESQRIIAMRSLWSRESWDMRRMKRGIDMTNIVLVFCRERVKRWEGEVLTHKICENVEDGASNVLADEQHICIFDQTTAVYA